MFTHKQPKSLPLPKLAIVTTHPIQYYAPLFRLLTARGHIAVKVFYTWGQVKASKYDPDFGREIQWDIDLLAGYDYVFVENAAKKPGSRHFKGIDNPTLISEIEQWDPAAILVFGWAFKSHLRVLRHFKSYIPVFFRGDSTLLDEPVGFSLKKAARRLFLQWVYTHIDIAFFVGKRNKIYFLKHGVNSNKLVSAPHAIDNARFAQRSGNQAAEEWRRNRGIAPTARVFLFAGKFIAKKDPQLLLQAFLALNHPNAVLVFVGNGILEENLKQACFGHHRVFFEPFQNQSSLPVVYRACDVFVLPSRGPGETWGLAVNEAMACSRPVIVSDKCGCAPDLVVDGKNGFVFQAGNLQQLVAALQKCMNVDETTLQAMGQSSFIRVQRFSFENICRPIEDIMLAGS